MNELASTIVVIAAIAWVSRQVAVIVAEVWAAVSKKLERRRRAELHKTWLAARVRARKLTEERMRMEGRWDITEITETMDAAGEMATPGYHPWR